MAGFAKQVLKIQILIIARIVLHIHQYIQQAVQHIYPHFGQSIISCNTEPVVRHINF